MSIFLKCKTTVCQLAQVGSQSEELKPSLKEAGTEVNWEVVGPIIAGDYFFFVLHILKNEDLAGPIIAGEWSSNRLKTWKTK